MFRIIRALKNSLDGIKALWHKDTAFRQEVYLNIIIIPVILILNIHHLLKIILILLLLQLLVTEAVNSAIETIIDRISLEINPQSKMAKDIGSAAVGLVFLMNIIAWIYTLFFAIKF